MAVERADDASRLLRAVYGAVVAAVREGSAGGAGDASGGCLGNRYVAVVGAVFYCRRRASGDTSASICGSDCSVIFGACNRAARVAYYAADFKVAVDGNFTDDVGYGTSVEVAYDARGVGVSCDGTCYGEVADGTGYAPEEPCAVPVGLVDI